MPKPPAGPGPSQWVSPLSRGLRLRRALPEPPAHDFQAGRLSRQPWQNPELQLHNRHPHPPAPKGSRQSACPGRVGAGPCSWLGPCKESLPRGQTPHAGPGGSFPGRMSKAPLWGQVTHAQHRMSQVRGRAQGSAHPGDSSAQGGTQSSHTQSSGRWAASALASAPLAHPPARRLPAPI